MNSVKKSVAAAAIAALTACAGGGPAGSAVQALPATAVRPATASPIQHVVVVIQENRSFDDFFATFPNADGTKTGVTHGGKTIPLSPEPLVGKDIGHAHSNWLLEYDKGKMDGFNLEPWNPPKSSRTGRWPRSTRCSITCFKPKPAAASPPTKI